MCVYVCVWCGAWRYEFSGCLIVVVFVFLGFFVNYTMALFTGVCTNTYAFPLFLGYA